MLSRPGLEVGANNQSPLKGLTSQLTLRLQSFSKDFAPLARLLVRGGWMPRLILFKHPLKDFMELLLPNPQRRSPDCLIR